MPVFDRPMIYYPIQTLINAGMTELMIVTGGEFAGDFLKLLGNGKNFGLKHLNYTYQEGEGGIAEALALCEHFIDGDSVCVILGDNIIENNINHAAAEFRRRGERGAMVLLKEVDDAQRFGVAEISDGKIVRILEKPSNPPTNFAVTGYYMYDARVFEFIRKLNRSARGELEITDANNRYIEMGELRYEFIEGWWTDAGTFTSLHRATNLVAQFGANKM